jgi:hypothetical protein
MSRDRRYSVSSKYKIYNELFPVKFEECSLGVITYNYSYIGSDHYWKVMSSRQIGGMRGVPQLRAFCLDHND